MKKRCNNPRRMFGYLFLLGLLFVGTATAAPPKSEKIKNRVFKRTKKDVNRDFHSINVMKRNKSETLEEFSEKRLHAFDKKLTVTFEKAERRIESGIEELLQDAKLRMSAPGLGKTKDVASLIIYKVPSWPVQSQLFFKDNFIGLRANINCATQSYASSGRKQDVSSLIFGECPIRIKDILLVSKLLDKGIVEVVPGGDKFKFLNILRNQELLFDASLSSQEVELSYIRHFFGGDLSVGLEVPIVRKEHQLKMSSGLTAEANENLKTETKMGDVDFFSLYPNGLIDFFKDILSKKNIVFSPNCCCEETDTRVGFGDISAFVNYEITSKYTERSFVGARALLPVSPKRNTKKLWDVELGNGGFYELSLFGSVLFSWARFLNPHIFVQGTYVFSDEKIRRVPKIKKSEGATVGATTKFIDDFMLYGDNVRHVASKPAFCEPDVTVRRFADCTRKTKIRPGESVFVRVGNTFEHIFNKRIFLDLFYDLYARGSDDVNCVCPGDGYDYSILKKNTFEISHNLGLNLIWQPDDLWRFGIGGVHTFAGRNTHRLFEASAFVSCDF